MNDNPREDDILPTEVRARPEREVVTQEEIDDVLGDSSLSQGEREARLSELRQRILDDEHARGDEEYAPMEAQIMDALSMLAEGGHDYKGSLRVGGQLDDASPSGVDVEPNPAS